ncbi:MAG: hypothetical protein RIB60_00030 [Phycisphaerales bacterium]
MASRKTRRVLVLSSAALLAGGAFLAGGCSNGARGEEHHAGDIVALRKDPSPAMESLNRRAADKRNRRAYVNDTNLRMLHDDVARVFHADTPSRLTPVTKPY